jgi:hypothetical protein
VEAERRSHVGLSDVIAAGKRDGSIRADVDPTASAVLLLGMMRGVAALLLTDSALADMGRIRNTCTAWIAHSLAAPPAAGGKGGQPSRAPAAITTRTSKR